MNPDGENLFIVGAIENTDPSPFRETDVGSPEKVVVKLLRRRRLEGEVCLPEELLAVVIHADILGKIKVREAAETTPPAVKEH